MNPRNQRREPTRSHGALVHRGPQAATVQPHAVSAVPLHAPNAALLIDFDNVTMGIRSDLGHELRNLLGSDIIKGKVAVQRAYADWRRYPQYIVPLTEASIDLIFAPAYGSSKKNATDIRLAIDALELVFTRPEIGTFILLSGDSDFSSLVIKLKEYGKYVIGVGIRESSSDLLVMNCDEYYSYNALAGLMKAGEEETARKYDPWELVTEAITRMKRNGDVMRSDRLKQVMQDIDSSFDEKNTGHSKFSKFVQDAAARGLLTLTKLENGQLEVSPPSDGARPAAAETPAPAPRAERHEHAEPAEERGGRRGRRGG
ncbi:MAG: NYN domain-containing protein, partial [Gemmatimonadota bacterium]|nr:NYN domain-containing protein [Gemmatimonadota bacterium]